MLVTVWVQDDTHLFSKDIKNDIILDITTDIKMGIPTGIETYINQTFSRDINRDTKGYMDMENSQKFADLNLRKLKYLKT